VARRRFELVLLGLFALTALLTASVGIYGIISSAVARRASEMGIRIALGARPIMIHSLILREGLTPVAAGLAGGIVASVALGRALRGLLFQVTPWNPAVLVTVVVLLGAVAVVACLIPSRRAVALGPMVLRGE
jgi:ABC-type antimicrobial peptide transport system permease subunit